MSNSNSFLPFSASFLIGLVACYGLSAASPLTLQEAIASAFSKGDESKNIQEEYKMGQGQIEEYVGFTLPQVTLTTGTFAAYNALAPQMNSQKLNQAFMSGGSSSGTGSTPAPQITAPSHIWAQQYNWNLQVFQTLNVSRVNIVRELAKNQEQLIELNKKSKQDQLSLKVVDSYVAAINAKENYDLQVQFQKANAEILRFSEVELKKGALPQINYSQIKAQADLSASQAKQAQVLYQGQIRGLKDLIGLEGEVELPSGEQNLEFLKYSEVKSASENSSVKLLKEQSQFAANTVRYEKSNYIPSINFVGSINNSVTAMDLSEIEKDGKAIGTDRRWADAKYYIDSDWFNYSVGVQLEWKIFDGFMTGAKVAQAQSKAEMAKRSVSILEKDLNSKLAQTQEFIEVSLSVYLTAKVAREAAQKTYEKDQADYKSGRIRLADLLQSESNFASAHQRTIEAYNRYLSALVQLRILNGQSIQGENR